MPNPWLFMRLVIPSFSYIRDGIRALCAVFMRSSDIALVIFVGTMRTISCHIKWCRVARASYLALRNYFGFFGMAGCIFAP